MYAGFITAKHTANWLGVHQKFNKVAYRQIVPFVRMQQFPAIDRILHFEGYNGPDGVKVKSAHRHDEPSHFYNPQNEEGAILGHLDNHWHSFIKALQKQDTIKAAFEASWLAHVITDGLTPAHHHPYEEELKQLYATSNQEIQRPSQKVFLQGDTKREMIKQNWQMWGRKGLLSTHIYFEMGVAAAVITGRFNQPINPAALAEARQLGHLAYFKKEAADIDRLNIYEEFYRTGWTTKLARMIRHQLAPTMTQAIAIEWILAAEAAGLTK